MKYKEELCDIIIKMIDTINLKEEKRSGYGYHGSIKGDEIHYTVYYNEYKHEYTDKDSAIRGYIFSKLSPIIDEVIKNKKK